MYSFWLQKGVENPNQYNFQIFLFTLFFLNALYHYQIKIRRQKSMSMFFQSKYKKITKYSFWLQKVVKF